MIFGQSVTNCAYTASLAVATGTGATGAITLAQRAFNANGVRVETRNLAGTLTDKAFNLIVVC